MNGADGCCAPEPVVGCHALGYNTYALQSPSTFQRFWANQWNGANVFVLQGIRGFVVHVDESRALDGTQAPNTVRWVYQSNEVRCI
jgi:hypothetical protein